VVRTGCFSFELIAAADRVCLAFAIGMCFGCLGFPFDINACGVIHTLAVVCNARSLGLPLSGRAHSVRCTACVTSNDIVASERGTS
jgi:hypothetical protein